MASNIDETSRPALTSTPRQQNLSRIASDPRWFSVLSVVLLFTAWYLGTEVLHAVPSNFLPSPPQLGHAFIDLWEHGYAGTPLWDHVLTSLLRMLTGFMLSVLVAVPLGLLMGSSPRVRAFLNPIFNSLRPVPSIALIPLMVLWFGIGETAKVFVIFLASFLFVVLNTSAGVATVPSGLVRAAVNLGATRLQLFWRVIFPASLPAIMTGLKTGLAVSWAVVVAAELLGAQKGLGYMIEDAATFYRIADVYVGVILIGGIGLAMTAALSWIEHRLIHWAGKA
jgi:ABC-type nitrate/sulfonate/bicarbonate transport system permease component